MKRKRIINIPTIVLLLVIFFVIVYLASLWIEDLAKVNDSDSTIEMQEYHSQDGSLVVEVGGYITIIKQ